jgi:type IX secretion system PorP/SprF family membrane protein
MNAQQDAQFSQNMFITAPVNPGASGIKGMHCFDLVARQQWIGFEGKPETGLISYNGPILSNFGIGGVLVYDIAGMEQNINLKLNGARHFSIGSNGGKLGIGLDLGVIQKGFRNIPPKAYDANDPTINGISGTSDMVFDVGFGIFYYKPKSLYFGVSGQKLLPQTLSLNLAKPNLRQHAYITTGYFHDAGNGLVLKPNMLVKTDLTSHQIDVNLTAEFNNRIWIGGSYRVQDAIVANIGFKTQKTKNSQPLKIGFAYDFTTQGLKNKGTFTSWDENGKVAETKENNRSIGGVELYIGYCIIPPPAKDFGIYADPLFL